MWGGLNAKVLVSTGTPFKKAAGATNWDAARVQMHGLGDLFRPIKSMIRGNILSFEAAPSDNYNNSSKTRWAYLCNHTALLKFKKKTETPV